MTSLNEKRDSYPRVSTIIGKQNADEMKSIPIEALAKAYIRGQKVHDYCTAWVRHLLVSDIEPEYKPYFDAFTVWANEHVDQTLHSAIRLYDDEKRFTGEFDMIVKMKTTGETALINITTSATVSKVWPVQLAAYAHLCELNGFRFDKVFNVHLKKTHGALYEEKKGEKVLVSPPQIKVCVVDYGDIRQYWDIFTSCLKCYDFFDRKEAK